MALLGTANIFLVQALPLLAKCLCILYAGFGVYSIKRSYDIKTPKHQQNELEYTFGSDIYQQYQMQYNINNQNMNYNYAGTQQSLYPTFQDDTNRQDLPSEEEINRSNIQISSAPANIKNMNVNDMNGVKPIDEHFLPNANDESLDGNYRQPAQEKNQNQKIATIKV